jgi:hypothetical protein
LIGFAGLGTDVVFALNRQRQMQAVASAAAFSGATALKTGRDYTQEARGVAAQAGYPRHERCHRDSEQTAAER